jgi:hypothetical protein
MKNPLSLPGIEPRLVKCFCMVQDVYKTQGSVRLSLGVYYYV